MTDGFKVEHTVSFDLFAITAALFSGLTLVTCLVQSSDAIQLSSTPRSIRILLLLPFISSNYSDSPILDDTKRSCSLVFIYRIPLEVSNRSCGLIGSGVSGFSCSSVPWVVQVSQLNGRARMARVVRVVLAIQMFRDVPMVRMFSTARLELMFSTVLFLLMFFDYSGNCMHTTPSAQLS